MFYLVINLSVYLESTKNNNKFIKCHGVVIFLIFFSKIIISWTVLSCLWNEKIKLLGRNFQWVKCRKSCKKQLKLNYFFFENLFSWRFFFLRITLVNRFINVDNWCYYWLNRLFQKIALKRFHNFVLLH